MASIRRSRPSKKDGVIFFPKARTNSLPKHHRNSTASQRHRAWHSHPDECATSKTPINKAAPSSISSRKVQPRSRQKLATLQGLDAPTAAPRFRSRTQADRSALQRLPGSKLPRPTDCLAPIACARCSPHAQGREAEFYAASSASPTSTAAAPSNRGAIAFGGELPQRRPRHPLRQPRPLLSTLRLPQLQAVAKTGWRNYNLSQPPQPPQRPIVVMIHMASVWVRSRRIQEAIRTTTRSQEMKLCVDGGAASWAHISPSGRNAARKPRARDVFERYIGEITKP